MHGCCEMLICELQPKMKLHQFTLMWLLPVHTHVNTYQHVLEAAEN